MQRLHSLTTARAFNVAHLYIPNGEFLNLRTIHHTFLCFQSHRMCLPIRMPLSLTIHQDTSGACVHSSAVHRPARQTSRIFDLGRKCWALDKLRLSRADYRRERAPDDFGHRSLPKKYCDSQVKRKSMEHML